MVYRTACVMFDERGIWWCVILGFSYCVKHDVQNRSHSLTGRCLDDTPAMAIDKTASYTNRVVPSSPRDILKISVCSSHKILADHSVFLLILHRSSCTSRVVHYTSLGLSVVQLTRDHPAVLLRYGTNNSSEFPFQPGIALSDIVPRRTRGSTLVNGWGGAGTEVEPGSSSWAKSQIGMMDLTSSISSELTRPYNTPNEM